MQLLTARIASAWRVIVSRVASRASPPSPLLLARARASSPSWLTSCAPQALAKGRCVAISPRPLTPHHPHATTSHRPYAMTWQVVPMSVEPILIESGEVALTSRDVSRRFAPPNTLAVLGAGSLFMRPAGGPPSDRPPPLIDPPFC